jgi:hypothetical protein
MDRLRFSIKLHITHGHTVESSRYSNISKRSIVARLPAIVSPFWEPPFAEFAMKNKTDLFRRQTENDCAALSTNSSRRILFCRPRGVRYVEFDQIAIGRMRISNYGLILKSEHIHPTRPGVVSISFSARCRSLNQSFLPSSLLNMIPSEYCPLTFLDPDREHQQSSIKVSSNLLSLIVHKVCKVKVTTS